ncbi:MAG: glycosyltransferase family 4 protein [Sulfolobales archaeon]|nr:glycosyltransferase family 4 protein [Sulfolobales archaeon]MDW8083017.1 glycosyltransferase family 4 protein [Sulfolobales archaeon]
MRTIEVVSLSPGAGGAHRASQVIRYRGFLGIECYSVVLDASVRDETATYSYSMCPPIGYAQFALPVRRFASIYRRWVSLITPINTLLHHSDRFNIDVVVGHHETLECIKATIKISDRLNSKKVLTLQLPLYYGNSTRKRRIEDAYRLYLDMIRSCGDNTSYLTRLAARRLDSTTEWLYVKTIQRLIDRFDLVISVSKAIEMDMGVTSKNIVTLRNGIGFEEAELNFLKKLRTEIRGSADTKKPCAIYSSRRDVSKGIIEALVATRLIRRNIPNFKLIITGRSAGWYVDAIVSKLIERLDIKKNVWLAGFLPRTEVLKLRKSSRVLIYPSHVDAYPYTVAETLTMGIPVVAYRIPALTINYGDIEGLFLVDEGDVEGLAQKVVEVLEKGQVDVGLPRIPTVRDVVTEEVALLRRLVRE